ncbi:hypothetical protein Patl1_03979 [Pistacia atlantica]|uniref:Uncharacterized protein n=1 Tax=Pistacia atlantica TaxID=434234 RepID=A0ACC1BV04_9ROSI|nr:hypothetical protein Patl1_03979 [Pistacia atlantica]
MLVDSNAGKVIIYTFVHISFSLPFFIYFSGS